MHLFYVSAHPNLVYNHEHTAGGREGQGRMAAHMYLFIITISSLLLLFDHAHTAVGCEGQGRMAADLTNADAIPGSRVLVSEECGEYPPGKLPVNRADG